VYRVADYIADFFADRGIKNVYSLPGGGAMHLIDAFTASESINHISFFHEQGASIAAEASGRTANNDCGVCCVTSGPGATNAITAVAGAWIDSVALIIISGQVKRSDSISGRPIRQGGVQEVEITRLVEPITKGVFLLNKAEDIVQILPKAFDLAVSGRKGPVWIDVPLDIQGAPITRYSSTFFESSVVQPVLYQSDIDMIVDLIMHSKRPLFYWGHGVKLDGAEEVLRSFVDTFQFPCLFTWNASDLLPYHHPLNFGRPGVVAQRHSNFIVQLADVIISIGSSLDNVLTAYAPKKFGKQAKVVVVDIDPNQLEEIKITTSKKINATAGQFILTLTNSLFAAGFEPEINDWIEECGKLKLRFENDFPADPRHFTSDPRDFDRISHKDFVLGISDILPENQLICTGSSGLAIEAFYMMFRNKIGQKYFLTSGLGSMGYGLPASIGVAVENPGRKVVLVESDGSLAMNIQEMQTVKNLDLPICVLLMNNSGYASIRNTMRNYFDGRYFGTGAEAGHAMPDFEKLAVSYGFKYKFATSVEHIRQAFQNFESSCQPMLVDVQLRVNETLAPKCIALPQDDGSIVSMPMEDMSPLLSLRELRSVMGNSISDISINARDQ
jgi:acetolactate synthase-1/2/3 large subunit